MKTHQQPYYIVLNAQNGQQVAGAAYDPEHLLRMLSGAGWYTPSPEQSKTEPEKSASHNAEIIGRKGYALYKS